jgi:hypothetical protein
MLLNSSDTIINFGCGIFSQIKINLERTEGVESLETGLIGINISRFQQS